MVGWLRYHWVVRRRARRMLRDYVTKAPVGAERDAVIDLTDDTHPHAKVRAAS